MKTSGLCAVIAIITVCTIAARVIHENHGTIIASKGDLNLNTEKNEGVRDDSAKCGDNLNWMLSDGTLTISGTGDMYNFSAGGSPWYEKRSSIKAINIEQGVTSIGNYAFYLCVNTVQLTISSTTIRYIGTYAFSLCMRLTELNIPSGVVTIASWAFSSCSGATKVTIPSTVTSIGAYAFCLCSKLTEVTIPSSVTSIGESVFSQCTQLQSVSVQSGNPKYSSIDGVLVDIQSHTLLTYPAGKANTSYVIPAGILAIGARAFSSCLNLIEVTLPRGLLTIGTFSFEYCKNLKNITIPSSVTTLSFRCFMECTGLTSIAVEPGNTRYSSIDGVLVDYKSKTLVRYPTGKSGSSYTIPSNVTSIGGFAFEQCEELTSVTIHESVSKLNIYALANWPGLKSIFIPESVTQIEGSCFESSTNLESVFYQGSTTISKTDFFIGCKSMKIVCVPPDYPSTTFGGWTVNSTSQICINYRNLFNHCYRGSYKDGNFETEKRKNATEWEARSNHCYEYQCNNSWGPYSRKRDNATELEERSNNHCYEFRCINETGELQPKKRDNATKWEAQSNHCYEFLCINETGELESRKRENATELETRSNNHCYEFLCINETGELEPRKRENATELEARSNNHCYEFLCINETGELESRKRENATEWEAQSNHCYEYQCINGSGGNVWKRENASAWENRSNGCIEYQCDNEKGEVWWSICNSSDEVHRTCVNDHCMEKEVSEEWTVEIELDNVKAIDVEAVKLVEDIARLSGVKEEEITIGIVVDEDGNVLRIIVYISSEEAANTISVSMESLDKGEGCEYGVLCNTSKVVVKGNGTLSSANRILINAVFLIVCLVIVVNENSLIARHL